MRDQGDLTGEEARALAAAPDCLNVVATTQMGRGYKMQLLAAVRREGALPSRRLHRFVVPIAENRIIPSSVASKTLLPSGEVFTSICARRFRGFMG